MPAIGSPKSLLFFSHLGKHRKTNWQTSLKNPFLVNVEKAMSFKLRIFCSLVINDFSVLSSSICASVSPGKCQWSHKASLLMHFFSHSLLSIGQISAIWYFWILTKKGHQQFLLPKDKNDMNYGERENGELWEFWEQTGINLGSERNSWLFSEIVPRSSSLPLPILLSMQIRKSKKP